MEYTFTTNFHIWGQGPPGAPGPDSSPPQCVAIGHLSEGVQGLMEYTFSTNFHIWGQGPPGPRARLAPKLPNLVSYQGPGPVGYQIRVGYAIMEYTFTMCTPYLGPGAPKGPGPDSPPKPTE